ncbi:DUF3558 family protein [Saccharopolyspora hattusasensis]|uniref:DUF3558 family protein n=1 Tax=Saccharopolyspora hattusasensis TaxID=1128679 RepID=UPI003D97B4A4
MAGCGGPGGGGVTPQPGESGEGSPSSSAQVAAIDPCQTLTSGDATALSLKGSGEPKRISGAAACDWNLATGGGIQIVVNHDKSLDELNFTGQKVEETSVAGRRAKLVADSVLTGTCGVSFETSSASSISVVGSVPARQNPDTACEIAQKAAPLVAANFPKN